MLFTTELHDCSWSHSLKGVTFISMEVRAPMPGLVLKLEVEPGDVVHEGTGLVVLEAMKMENEIFATGEAVVEEIHVEAGVAVSKGQLLVTLR